MTHSNCYERGHAPNRSPSGAVCAKCGEPLFLADGVWHTQAELVRLWKGVDREAARAMGEER